MQSMIWAEKIICNRGKSECSHKFGGNINLEMGWMCWRHLQQRVPVYGRGIPLRLLFDADVCYPPVAQTRLRSNSGLGGRS